LREWIEVMGKREDDVEVFDGEQLAVAGGEPALCGQALTLGAVAIPTRVVGEALGATRRADGPVSTEHGAAATGDGVQSAVLRAGQTMGATIRVAMSADDVG
jgi:hypothetical protein